MKLASAVLVLSAAIMLAVCAPFARGASCELPDNGLGTVDLPPNCPQGYLGHMAIRDGLPPGTTIEIDATLMSFYNVTQVPGGLLGGEVQTWSALLFLDMQGTGALSAFRRAMPMDLQGETHSAPRTPYDPVQSFSTVLNALQGQVIGDPDFDLLRITAGNGFGMPSPGHTTLTQLPSTPWAVDSFFDITYRIDFVGAPGGSVAGMSGSTTGVERFQAGEPAAGCTLPDNGQGTADMPPDCPRGYLGQMTILDGLPVGTSIEIDAGLVHFHNVVRTPGGPLGGEVQSWTAQLQLALAGTGSLTGFHRSLTMTVQGQTHTAPRSLGDPLQSFDAELHLLQGQIMGDPDFDLLRITGGTGFGMPSPGHTTLTQLPGGSWAVDSFFDITYRIDFVGAPGGSVAGMSGSTTGSDRFQITTLDPADVPGELGSPSRYELRGNRPNPFQVSTTIDFTLPGQGGPATLDILDVSGRVIRTLVDRSGAPGVNSVTWDGRTTGGERAASGVYFYRFTAPGFGQTQKLMLLR